MILCGLCKESLIRVGSICFNNEGRYLKTVLKWGQGPEEAYDIWSIKLLDGSIYLLINSGTEVVEYSLQKQKMVELLSATV